ncbi:MAG: choice-of-anchor B family protein [Bacteroidia bacterium]|nr:choice-of-anchor B family protein [Bacteroidia bacterium]
MKKISFIIILIVNFLNNYQAQTYPSLNITLLSHLDPETDVTGSDNRKYSGCWGWAQTSKNKEYAIIGTSKQTFFIDVTNPSIPVIVDSVQARRAGCTYKEIKTYENFCYLVSDDSSPNSFQIVDMQYLPDSVHVVYDGTTLFEKCHTIFVDNGHLYCGGPTTVGNGTESMHIYSLATPTAPVLLRKLSQDIPGITYVHDMYVRNDTIYASCGGQGLFIIKFNTATNTFSLIQSYTGYLYNGYNHSSWQTDNRKTMVFADEVPTGLPAKVIDVSDLNNITLVDTINSHPLATPHNPYIVGNNWCWISTYHDGIYLYNISNPSNTTIHGYFDTHPQQGAGNSNATYTGYRGNWGAYPYLPSKIIITCDMQNGVFILEGDATYKNLVGINENNLPLSVFSVYPNPAQSELNFLIANQLGNTIQCTITDILGKIVFEKTIIINEAFYKTSIDTNPLNNGCYFITLKGKNINETKKVLIQK